jgi:hypothetical protein
VAPVHPVYQESRLSAGQTFWSRGFADIGSTGHIALGAFAYVDNVALESTIGT